MLPVQGLCSKNKLVLEVECSPRQITGEGIFFFKNSPYNTMKKLILLALCLLIRFGLNEQFEKVVFEKPLIEQKTSVEVDATMYYAEASQCDSDPLVTAGMYKINPHKASEHKWIAMSRDLLARWGGLFHYGDKVLIEGTGGKDGVYMVADCMNKRFTKRIDILETKGTKFYKYEGIKITKI